MHVYQNPNPPLSFSIRLTPNMPSPIDKLSDSDSEDSDGFKSDMEALRSACIITGKQPDPDPDPEESDDEDDDDDLELIRNIQRRFAPSKEDSDETLFLRPICSLPPVVLDDDLEDDFETLRAIQRRFVSYNDDNQKNRVEDFSHKPEQVGATNIGSEKETSNNLFVYKTNKGEGFPNSVDASNTTKQSPESFSDDISDTHPSDLIEWHESGAENVDTFPVKDSGFPKSAQVFVDAIKKNRSCQKFIRSKLMHIEARIEEIKKLKERIKILKDFQVSCKKRTGRALSQKKDARVQLISAAKPRAHVKVNERKVSASHYGPAENSHVANYKMALKKFPLSLSREKWSKEEKENLGKGIKQQFQEMLLQKSVDLFSGAVGSSGDSNDFDSIIASIKDLDITPENTRLFLPKVNWDQLASMYLPGRSGAECESRWLNCEDPLINHHSWTKMEDKNLLHTVQQRGINNWIDIAVSLVKNRTPFQCLARYQRSLNASILKREWTEDEDDKLRAAVQVFGESNWQFVASSLQGRTGTQCSNRWIKSLHPARQKVGRWISDEDKRLKVAVMLFGPKNWTKIAQFVPGRTQVQCRERWVNCLDPSLNMDEWTEEEDLKLKASIDEHGYFWSKVAACIPPRTDSQCLRRWKVLLPHEVPLLQAARKIQKAGLISNFVDRESERPALGPNDFVPLPQIKAIPECQKVNLAAKRKKKPSDICLEDDPLLTNCNEVENFSGEDAISRKKGVKRQRAKSKNSSITQDLLLPCPDTRKKGVKRQHSKSKNSTTTEDLLLHCPDTMLSVTTSEVVGIFGGDNAIKKEKAHGQRKRKSRGRLKSKKISTASGHDAIFNGTAVMEPCPKEDDGCNRTPPLRCSTPDILENGNSRASSCLGQQCRTKKSKKSRDRSSSKAPTIESEDGDDNMTLASLIIAQSNKHQNSAVFSNKVVKFCSKQGRSTKIVDDSQNLSLHAKRSRSDPPDKGNSSDSDYCRNSMLKNLGTGECVFSDERSDTENGYDVTLASVKRVAKLCSKRDRSIIIGDGSPNNNTLVVKCSTPADLLGNGNSIASDCVNNWPENTRTAHNNCSSQVSEAENGEDMTLASYCNRLRKNKFKRAKKGKCL